MKGQTENGRGRQGRAGRWWFFFLICLGAVGCTERNPLARPEDGGADAVKGADGKLPPGDGKLPPGDGKLPPGDSGGKKGLINIYVKGDLTKGSFTDKLSGQTPTDYQIALSRYDILTSAADPKPQLCFDHGNKPFVVDVYKDNLVGACNTATLKSGMYTHGRTRVDWARYTVNGTYHLLGKPWPGKITFFRAYSDTTYQGKSYKANTGVITYTGLTTASIPMVYPPLPSIPGVQFQTVNGQFFMTFAFTKPLPIVQTNKDDHWARFHWMIKESFRWSELKLAGYTDGTWDMSPVTTEIEPVMLHGVSGYYVTSSVD